MANYVESIRVGTGEVWPVRDAEGRELINTANTRIDEAYIQSTPKQGKCLIFSQTDNNGEYSLSTPGSYPSSPGIYRIGSTFSGLPSGANGYGILFIIDAGTYQFHMYCDSYAKLYWARRSTGSHVVTAPASWQTVTSTSVDSIA